RGPPVSPVPGVAALAAAGRHHRLPAAPHPAVGRRRDLRVRVALGAGVWPGVLPAAGRIRPPLWTAHRGHRYAGRRVLGLVPRPRGRLEPVLRLPPLIYGGHARRRHGRQSPDPLHVLGDHLRQLVSAHRLLAHPRGIAGRRLEGHADHGHGRLGAPGGVLAFGPGRRHHVPARTGREGAGNRHTPLLPGDRPFDLAWGFHQVGAGALSLVAAGRHGRADAGERVPAFGHHGQGGALPRGPHGSHPGRDGVVVL